MEGRGKWRDLNVFVKMGKKIEKRRKTEEKGDTQMNCRLSDGKRRVKKRSGAEMGSSQI